MKIKALSIRQPWADLVACGQKTIETRTWATKYRGWLLICASKDKDYSDRTGCALALARLVECRPMIEADEEEADCRVYDGAQAWVFDDIRPLPAIERFPVRGFPGLFDVRLPEGADLLPGQSVLADLIRELAVPKG